LSAAAPRRQSRPTHRGGSLYFKPRAFIVIGTLDEFVSEHGVNTEKVRSFELYRNSIVGIEILTFDELYERSRFIVEANQQSSTQLRREDPERAG
jgi:hypothetical protein